MHTRLTLLLGILLIFYPSGLIHAYNLRNISNTSGLSNSAILSMCQDMDGIMWFGSVDGLNRYNGVSIQTYKPSFEESSLSGNLIESIVQSADGNLWVQTNYGLNRFNPKSHKGERYNNYISNYKLRTHSRFELFFVNEKMELVCFDPQNRHFIHHKINELEADNEILDYTIDEKDNLWVFTRKHTITAHIKWNDDRTLCAKQFTLIDNTPMVFCSHQGNKVYMVDNTMSLYEYNMDTKLKYYIDNIASINMQNDRITDIVKHNNDYFIALQTNGLKCLRKNNDSIGSYLHESINVNAGIFSLLSDRNQDVVWIGTDGNGVYAYYNSKYSVKSTTYSNNLKGITMPVRTIFVNKDNTLWLGTKGNGIVRIADYNMNKVLHDHKIDYFTNSNSGLSNNSVYAIVGSRKGIMWIGSDDGIDYYNGKTISNLNTSSLSGGLKYVHSITEVNDTTILVATVGTGVVKLTLKWSGDNPSVTGAKRYLIGTGKLSENYFFSSYRESEQTVWFGNRGYGVYRFDMLSDSLIHMPFNDITSNRTVNDIFSIHEDQIGNIWFGTSYGLVKHSDDSNDKVFYEQDGLPNNTVHGILSDKSGNIWLSTNMGIAMLNTKTSTSLILNQSGEQQVLEFSDGAYFKDPKHDLLFFGGTNGFVTIKEEEYPEAVYMPSIRIDQLRVFGQAQNINEYLDDKGQKLRFNHKENFIALDAIVTDYINNNGYTYMYMLEGLSDSWIDNGTTNTIYLTNLFPGNYILKLKYINRLNNTESAEYSIKILIMPPWYLSLVAKIIYVLIMVLSIVFMIRMFMIRSHRKREFMLEKLSQDHQKEVYESKLRFFTNIAHEFCTPLTLISAPCDRLIDYKRSDSQIVQYAELIKRNALRMNLLIQDLIEFRRIETDNKQMHITKLDIAVIINQIASDFNFVAEEKQIDYQQNIPAHIEWNSDNDFIIIIVSNLISNAFKYTKKGGKVNVGVQETSSALKITITNSGKCIKKEDIDRIFDRYTILEELENTSGDKPSTRNGLGLAISSNLVKLLGGKIDISSSTEHGTTFIITLYPLDTDQISSKHNSQASAISPLANTDFVSLEIPKQEFDKYRPTVMVIDNETDILWLFSDIFTDDYNVITVSDSRKVQDLMLEIHPDVVICDMMMPHVGGVEITHRLKSDARTAHISIIIVSAIQQIDDQIKCLEAGAEMYMTKPFDVNYLKAFVKQLITRREKMREYFSSPISAYEFMGGKFTHKDHKRFVQQIFDIINSNIMNKKLSVLFIANELGMSTRHLYRKINEINAPSPSDMIRECRLHIAKDLLLNSKLTIDEIIFKSGFSSRGPFFTAFTEKFECSPKEFRKSNSITI